MLRNTYINDTEGLLYSFLEMYKYFFVGCDAVRTSAIAAMITRLRARGCKPFKQDDQSKLELFSLLGNM